MKLWHILNNKYQTWIFSSKLKDIPCAPRSSHHQQQQCASISPLLIFNQIPKLPFNIEKKQDLSLLPQNQHLHATF